MACKCNHPNYDYYDDGDIRQHLTCFPCKWEWYRVTEDSDEPLFGFELEVINKGNINPALMIRIVENSDEMLCVSDSSLPENAMEIISHPATIDYYRYIFDWTPMQLLANNGWETTFLGEGALHIHVSRSAFLNDEHVDRFADSVESLYHAIGTAGGMFAPKRDYFGFDLGLPMNERNGSYRPQGKYAIVNKMNKATVEVRAFAPSFSGMFIWNLMEYMRREIEETRSKS